MRLVMDALSDVLRAVRLTGATFFDVHASEPWVAATPQGSTIVSGIFPGADHLVSYHVVTRGGCWAAVAGESPLRLAEGDIIVFPHGDPHTMSSRPGLRPEPPDMAFFRRPTDQQLPFRMSMGKTGAESAQLVCGFLGCDSRPFNPLLAALPKVIHLSGPAGAAATALVRFAVSEAKERRPGGECVLGHLSELMFVDVVRRYLEALPEDRRGWLAGLRDPFIGRALTALHRQPAHEWTLESLAREAGLSRTALAERFLQFVGEPPMHYLTKWRMQLAANDLRNGIDNIATIAERVGYESEAAFSRAFKKALGVPPSQWRKRTGTITAGDVAGPARRPAPRSTPT
jgi:AraC-like DNA-binding protein